MRTNPIGISRSLKTILLLEDGATLVASPGGDQYWVQDPQGQRQPCSLEQACAYWLRYGQDGVPAPPARVETEYSPWQHELLEKLGLTPLDLAPRDEPAQPEKKRRSNKDR